MINLIPPTGKKRVKKEYMIRAISVWNMLLIVAFLILVLMLLPTYVLLDQRLEALLIEYNQLVTNDIAEYEDARIEIQNANTIALQLNTKEHTAMSHVLERLIVATPPTVTLRSFAFRRNASDLMIDVTGTADTRRALVSFTDLVEAEDLFTEAHVPVSDLAQDTNLSFSAAITLATESSDNE